MGLKNRPLDTNWLEDFCALAETGSFSRAAEARAIAQPAFSRHIRALEEWVGADLFDRSTHPTELTAAGHKFLPLLKQVMADLEAARIKALAAHAQDAASLRFAATHLLSLMFFPRWLTRLEAELGVGAIQMMSDSFQACEDLMAQRRVQFLLCHRHPDVASRLDETPYPMVQLGTDVLMPVSAPAAGSTDAPAHALAGKGAVPFLAYGPASGLGRIVMSQLRQKSVRDGHVQATFVGPHATLLRSMAVQGRGVAWLPAMLVQDDLDAGRLVRAGGPEWDIPLEICLYRQPFDMAQVAERLWALAQGAPAP
ncbi:LysR family transcriptional regulator [Bordetella genomosp. 5]|uniref:LysR family transcriptional regulator n=1 Tax=Bordetella genomosp. 5 TaxID=1395608 RepID=UPI000B9E5C40|nr:LysR family transcriptional regulator [Bordetella genomosp. 5]OZI42031.1 LysR family transcriptional regulator [Bordetella genomosp. 5]